MLGVSFARGSAAFPDAPPLAAAAELPGYDIGAWIGYAAAPGTPREVVARLSAEVQKAIQAPDVRERFTTLGLEPRATSPEEMGAFLRNEQARYADIIKSANIKIE
jgi:tripartite-type tricarboxylate transporter receptor subunit TctC